jgi:flavorubredoxin
MEAARKINEDTYILPSYFPIPGLGLLPVNAFVLKAREPVLVDTGLHLDTDAFTRELEAVIDPTDLRWLYLTHGDQDHVGSLVRLVHAYPNLRVVTTFLGYGVLSLFTDIGPGVPPESGPVA